MDHFGALSAFVQAAHTRSFTETGRRTGVSSSAVGKAVARLEEELGVRLFHRSTRAITLTAEGSLFWSVVSGFLRNMKSPNVSSLKLPVTPRANYASACHSWACG